MKYVAWPVAIGDLRIPGVCPVGPLPAEDPVIGSFEVGVLMGAIVGAGVYHVFTIVYAWWRSMHPDDIDWDPTIERIRRL